MNSFSQESSEYSPLEHDLCIHGQHISNLHIPPKLISRHFHIRWMYPWLLKLDPSFPPAYLRLVLWIVMGMPPGSIVTLGCDCSSWTIQPGGHLWGISWIHLAIYSYSGYGNRTAWWVGTLFGKLNGAIYHEIKLDRSYHIMWSAVWKVRHLPAFQFVEESKDYFGMSTLCSGEFSLCRGTTTKIPYYHDGCGLNGW